MKEHRFNKIGALHLLILPYQQIYPYSLLLSPLTPYYFPSYSLLLSFLLLTTSSLLLHLLAFALRFLSFRTPKAKRMQTIFLAFGNG